MRLCATFGLAIAMVATAVTAGAAELAFKPAGAGFYAFDTGALRGKLRLDGRRLWSNTICRLTPSAW